MPEQPGSPDVAVALEVVVAHAERATVRVGEVFLKIDTDERRADTEVAAMAMAPVPTPEVLWRRHPVLALAAVPGRALGHLGEPSPAPREAWVAAGAAVRRLHDTAVPPWPGPELTDRRDGLARECDWLVTHDVLPATVVAAHRRRAEQVLRPCPPSFVHGDLQVDHVFVADGEVTGIIDWSEAAPGDPLADLATLTLGHPEHLDDVLDGYGVDFDVDLELLRGWWSFRCLTGVRWLSEHGYGPPESYPEVAFLRSGA